MLGFDSAAGKCCLANSNDACMNEQFYCSNSISTSFSYHKYAFCSFNPTICGTTSRNIQAKEVSQNIMTGLEFTINDVCPYFIVTDSNLPFNTRVKITVDQATNADVYLLQGSSMTSIQTQEKISSGSSTTLDSSKFGIIIVKGTYEAPFVSFSYQNEQIISNAGWIGIMIGTSMGYFIILVVSLIFITRCLTQRRLREMQSPNIVYFLKKKTLQYLSAKQDYTYQKVKDPDNSYKSGNDPYYDQPGKIPPLNLGYNNDHFMGQTDQLTRLDTALGNGSDQRFNLNNNPRFQAPSTQQSQEHLTNKPKVQIKPYKFDME